MLRHGGLPVGQDLLSPLDEVALRILVLGHVADAFQYDLARAIQFGQDAPPHFRIESIESPRKCCCTCSTTS